MLEKQKTENEILFNTKSLPYYILSIIMQCAYFVIEIFAFYSLRIAKFMPPVARKGLKKYSVGARNLHVCTRMLPLSLSRANAAKPWAPA